MTSRERHARLDSCDRASTMRRKPKTLATLIACGASWIAGSSPAMTVERLMVRPGLQARRRRFAPLPGHGSGEADGAAGSSGAKTALRAFARP